jgi:hypothetical protein
MASRELFAADERGFDEVNIGDSDMRSYLHLAGFSVWDFTHVYSNRSS